MSWTRLATVTAALVTTAFQVLTEAHAVPAVTMSPPWLDGRPTLQLVASGPTWRPGAGDSVRVVRFDAGRGPTYGLLEGVVVHPIAGDLFATPVTTGWTHRLGDVRLLAPLGPGCFGRAIWAGGSSGEGAEAAPALARLDATSLLGPGDDFAGGPGSALVRPVAGIVVGGPPGEPTAFGVTAGLVAYPAPERPQLALGPCVLEGGLTSRGDVLLVPLGSGVRRVARGDHAVVELPGVGALRCGLRG